MLRRAVLAVLLALVSIGWAEPKPEIVELDWDRVPVAGDEGATEARKALLATYEGRTVRVTGFFGRSLGGNDRIVHSTMFVPARRGDLLLKKEIGITFRDTDRKRLGFLNGMSRGHVVGIAKFGNPNAVAIEVQEWRVLPVKK